MYMKACLHFPSHDGVGDKHYEKHYNAVSLILGSLEYIFEEFQAKKKEVSFCQPHHCYKLCG